MHYVPAGCAVGTCRQLSVIVLFKKQKLWVSLWELSSDNISLIFSKVELKRADAFV